MSLLKNKHMIVAVIVAPVLALISFFATDFIVSEKPQAAQEGQSYTLVGRPNCRYTSGICTLKNGDMAIDVVFDNNQVTVESKLPLEGIKVGINDQSPVSLSSSDDQLNWQTPITKPRANDTLKLVAKVDGAIYFAEHSLGFVNKETLTESKR